MQGYHIMSMQFSSVHGQLKRIAVFFGLIIFFLLFPTKIVWVHAHSSQRKS